MIVADKLIWIKYEDQSIAVFLKFEDRIIYAHFFKPMDLGIAEIHRKPKISEIDFKKNWDETVDELTKNEHIKQFGTQKNDLDYCYAEKEIDDESVEVFCGFLFPNYDQVFYEYLEQNEQISVHYGKDLKEDVELEKFRREFRSNMSETNDDLCLDEFTTIVSNCMEVKN